jgi:hypothetical protein
MTVFSSPTQRERVAVDCVESEADVVIVVPDWTAAVEMLPEAADSDVKETNE